MKNRIDKHRTIPTLQRVNNLTEMKEIDEIRKYGGDYLIKLSFDFRDMDEESLRTIISGFLNRPVRLHRVTSPQESFNFVLHV